jgi:hypothetical protein
VGKLSQPIPISLETDTTFIVNFDIWYIYNQKICGYTIMKL